MNYDGAVTYIMKVDFSSTNAITDATDVEVKLLNDKMAYAKSAWLGGKVHSDRDQYSFSKIGGYNGALHVSPSFFTGTGQK